LKQIKSEDYYNTRIINAIVPGQARTAPQYFFATDLKQEHVPTVRKKICIRLMDQQFAYAVCADSFWSTWPPVPGMAVSVPNLSLTPMGQGDSAHVLQVTVPSACVAIKYAPDDTAIEATEKVLRVEARQLHAVSETILQMNVSPHVVAYYYSAVVHGKTVIAMRCLRENKDLWWLSQQPKNAQWFTLMTQVIFQTVFTIAVLQRVFPGFRHNDLKTANVLVGACTDSVTRIYHFGTSRFVMLQPQVHVTIIDFACAHAPAHPLLHNELVEDGWFQHHGIDNASTSSLYDLHLLFYGIASGLRHDTGNPFVAPVLEFIARVIPVQYFGEHALIDVHDNIPRLTFAAQQQLSNDPSSLPPDAALLDPFFAELATQSVPWRGAAHRYGILPEGVQP
jgi:hypothetical protein